MAPKPTTTAKQTATDKGSVKNPGRRVAAVAAKSAATPVARGAAPKKAGETVTLKGVFEQLAQTHEIPKRQAHALAAELVELVTRHLQNGDRIRMSGLGILEVKDR